MLKGPGENTTGDKEAGFFTGDTEIFSGVHIHVVYAVPLFSPQAYAATYSDSIQSLRSSSLPIGKYLEINFACCWP